MIENLPSLSENPVLRYFNFIALYIAQGIPGRDAFLWCIPEWMAVNNKAFYIKNQGKTIVSANFLL
jgi:hypothetical protein